MKLYKVTFETEVVILAEDEKEAISNASYYVKEETPELVEWDTVESMRQIPKWKGAIPYSSYPQKYNPHYKKCEEFVMKDYGGNTPIVLDETMEELLKNGVRK
jgi:hypothetical protein